MAARQRRAPPRRLASLAAALAALALCGVPRRAAAVSTPPAGSGAEGIKFQSIPALPGCSVGAAGGAAPRALTPELSRCSWSVQMARQSARWYAFEVAPDAAENMSVVIMARAVSGQITMALWSPGSDPYRSVPTQVGTNYMEWPGLRETDQEESQAGGGHASLASEQQYLFLSRRSDKALLAGQYVMVITADMGQPLVSVEVSTPSSMTQLVAEEQEALKDLVKQCCPGLAKPGSAGASTTSGSAAYPLTTWCSSVGQAVTYDLRQWYADICHVAPNVCSRDGHLQRLVLPPYALHCPAFPKALSKFSKLRHLDMSYSTAPGSIADVAAVVGQLPQLSQLHLRGVGLSGAFTCELLEAGKELTALALSDNDKLSGSLPPCWLTHGSLVELQLAGLSDLHGALPDVTAPGGGAAAGTGRRLASASSSSSGEQLCGFGKLRYINMAGIIGDAGEGFTGSLPPALGFCNDLLYLDLSGHSISGPLPPLPPALQFLNLSSNGLSASLPEFAVDAGLQYLDLSFNRFSGTLQDMTSLPSLDWLDLSDNELSGPLPPLPPSVRWADLSNNRLSGELKLPVAPRGGDGTSLVLFNVARNQLSGPIPAALAAQPHLAFLDLSHNELSGTLAEFAAGLPATNTLLQVNFSFNRLSGGVPPQLQQLAAVRPVLVTMRDGLTPATRIFDISHNSLSGTFPTWLLTNVPTLAATCQCSVGVALDGERFACPAAPPQLSRDAAAVLRRRFEQLTCTTAAGDDGMMSMMGGGQRATVPLWQFVAGSRGGAAGPTPAAAAPGFSHFGMMSRADHKAAMAPWLEQQAGGAGGTPRPRGDAAKHAALGVAAAVLALAALALLVRHSGVVPGMWRQRHNAWKAQAAGYSLLHGHGSYRPPSASDQLGSGSASASSSDGASPHYVPCAPLSGHDSPCSPYDGSSSPTASSASGGSGGSRRSGRASCSSGDGMCEIALVLRAPGAQELGEDGAPQRQQHAKGAGGAGDSFLV